MIVLYWFRDILIGAALKNPRREGCARGWWANRLEGAVGGDLTARGSGVENLIKP
jgi:hypothetical protein